MSKKFNNVWLYESALFICFLYLEFNYLTNFRNFVSKIDVLILIIVLSLLASKEYITIYNNPLLNIKKSISGFFFLVIVFFAFKLNYGWQLILAYIFVLSARDVNIENCLKPFLIATLLVICATIICSKFNVIDSYLLYDNGRVRNSLGFLYPSHPAHLFFFWVSSYVVLKNKNIKYIELLILLVFDFYFYVNTFTKDPFVLTIILILFTLILKLKPNFLDNRTYIYISNISFIVFPLLTLVFLYKAPSSWLLLINRLTNGRVMYALNALNKYGVHMLGQNVQFITRGNATIFNQYDFVDSGYIQSLVICGALFTVMMLLLYTKVIIDANKNKQELVSIVLFLIAIYNIFDPSFIYLWYNPFILLCGSYFSNNIKHYY